MIVALVAHVALTTPFISLPVTHPLVNTSPLLFWYQIKAMFSQPHLLLGVAMEQVMLGTGKGKGVGILGNHHGGVRPHPSQGMDRSCDGWALPAALEWRVTLKTTVMFWDDGAEIRKGSETDPLCTHSVNWRNSLPLCGQVSY